MNIKIGDRIRHNATKWTGTVLDIKTEPRMSGELIPRQYYIKWDEVCKVPPERAPYGTLPQYVEKI